MVRQQEGGATIQIAVPVRAGRLKYAASFDLATRWFLEDEALIASKIGEAGAQAKWEAQAQPA